MTAPFGCGGAGEARYAGRQSDVIPEEMAWRGDSRPFDVQSDIQMSCNKF
jgi:hypothetical protein